MSNQSESNALAHLNGQSPAEIRAWLDRALWREEYLPKSFPDDTPVDPILRYERDLQPTTRRDLREACRLLVQDFAQHPDREIDYVSALLRLAVGLDLDTVAEYLHTMASSDDFVYVRRNTQKMVLATLLDLRAPFPASFWLDTADRSPERFGVVAISGLLRIDIRQALAIVAMLPDDQNIADDVYVVLDQYAESVAPSAYNAFVQAVVQTVAGSRPEVQKMLREWLERHPPVGENHHG